MCSHYDSPTERQKTQLRKTKNRKTKRRTTERRKTECRIRPIIEYDPTEHRMDPMSNGTQCQKDLMSNLNVERASVDY